MSDGTKLCLIILRIIAKITGMFIIAGGIFVLFGAGIIWCINTVFGLGISYSFADMFAMSVLANIFIDLKLAIPRRKIKPVDATHLKHLK